MTDIITKNVADIAKLDAILKATTDDDSDSDSDFDIVLSDTEKENDSEKVALDRLENIDFNEFASYKQQVDSHIPTVKKINYQTAVALNKAQQKLLIEGIKRHQEMLDECNRRLMDLRRKRNDLIQGRTTPQHPMWYRCGVPYFKTRRNYNCPPNADVLRKKMKGELSVVDLPPVRFWLLEEREKLIKSVCEQSKNIRLAKLREKLKNISDDLVKEELKDWLETDPKRCVFPVRDQTVPIDWLKISSVDMKGRHMDEECKAMWYLNMHPHLNISSYGPLEFKKLKGIAETYNYRDWDAIAEELNTGRSGYHCFLYYQVQELERKRQAKWTREEDAYLSAIVEKCRIGNFIPWGKVAYYMKDRDKSQIYTRYMNTLFVGRKKGRFSEQEDLLILALVRKEGKNFPKIATFLPGRTAAQVRERYINNLQYQGVMTPIGWTIEEDKQIIAYVKTHGEAKWSEFIKTFQSSCFRDRTMVRHRWKVLKKYLDDKYNCDLDSVPRLKRHRSYQRYNEKQVNEVVEHLDGLAQFNENAYDIYNVNTLTGSVITNDVTAQEQFQQFFVSGYHFMSPHDEYQDIDIINALFLIVVLNGRIDVSLFGKFKSQPPIERKTLKQCKVLLNDLIDKYSDYSMGMFFDSYWQKHYRKSFSLEWNEENNLSTFFPIFFAALKTFQTVILTSKCFIRYVTWDPSNLDSIYIKIAGKYIDNSVKNECRMDIDKAIESQIKTNLMTRKCYEIISVNDESQNKLLLAARQRETFKLRLMSLYNFDSMKTIRNSLVIQYRCIVFDGGKFQIAQKEESDETEVIRSKGRPRKILPGTNRYKYPRSDDESIVDENGSKKMTAVTNRGKRKLDDNDVEKESKEIKLENDEDGENNCTKMSFNVQNGEQEFLIHVSCTIDK